MKIGVVSDTHSRELPGQMLKDFEKVDLIIHAGDFCSLKEYKTLAKIKDVQAVQGNMDYPEICKLFPRRQILEYGTVRIGLFHGEGPAQKILSVVEEEFKRDKVDAVIFGHSHQPFNECIKKTLYFNPGSPNDVVIAPYCSYGILEIANGQIDARIIKVK
ncbi:MAG: hypothetical protein A2787_08370 [Omnitrophica WOR_2 bacterium RIFCSPHIGHO2_01_FULL_48_9]|nr:MAG: hypothetical protein A3D10_07950 [Omnitrophica WOR_2 bacterium RIFCSPHIGHO2_02_FULL_48_11]OGX33356.1 MAG: hypothetical protein A2787_08370 [Omnitrophica WOR_2 bacterium RIFCSPHIGHO2_01_FULL_48_9]